MPAHTADGDIGKAVCSDGSTLMATMRCANQLADLLAKKAAATVRISAQIRGNVASQFKQARDIAIFVGKVTTAAGGVAMLDGTVRRDSEDLVAADRPVKIKRSRAKTRQPDSSMLALVGRVARLEAMRQRILAR